MGRRRRRFRGAIGSRAPGAGLRLPRRGRHCLGQANDVIGSDGDSRGRGAVGWNSWGRLLAGMGLGLLL